MMVWDGMRAICVTWGSNQSELTLGSTHFRIQSLEYDIIFTFSAGLQSSVFLCGTFGEIFSIHFLTLPKIVYSLSSHLQNPIFNPLKDLVKALKLI